MGYLNLIDIYALVLDKEADKGAGVQLKMQFIAILLQYPSIYLISIYAQIRDRKPLLILL